MPMVGNLVTLVGLDDQVVVVTYSGTLSQPLRSFGQDLIIISIATTNMEHVL
jgi:hypothetical protein